MNNNPIGNIMEIQNKTSEINSILEKAEFANLSESELKETSVFFIEMTPKIAQYMLNNNFKNQRKLSIGRIRKYAEEMLADNWRFNGECITIDNQGRLINGQHRCKAVILSGINISVMVLTGIANESFKTMDQGYKRSTSQIFSMVGIKNTSLLTASLRSYYGYLKHKDLNNLSLVNASTLEIEKLYNQSPDRFNEITTIALRSNSHLKFSGFAATMFAGLMMVIKDDPKSNDFMNRFNDQRWTSDIKCPIRFLHNVIKKARDQKDKNIKYSSTQKYNAIILAWNHFKTDKPLALSAHAWDKKKEQYKIK